MAVPSVPATFTKFPASLSGPFDDVEIVGGTIDWEVELVAVIGARADRVDEESAWPHVAGLTVGQDISDRTLQFAAGSQFSLGKSRRGYGPMGPWLVTLDAVANPDDLALGCSVDGETLQDAGRNQPLDRRGEATECRGGAEGGDADEEHARAADDVAEPAERQQAEGEGQHIGGNHPFDLAGIGAEVLLHRRDGDVDDGHDDQVHEALLRGGWNCEDITSLP